MNDPNCNNIAKYYNADAGIIDAPRNWIRNSEGCLINKPNISWTAITSILGFNNDGNWERITSFSWGFQTDSYGNMTIIPIQYNVTPSTFHINIISRIP